MLFVAVLRPRVRSTVPARDPQSSLVSPPRLQVYRPGQSLSIVSTRYRVYKPTRTAHTPKTILHYIVYSTVCATEQRARYNTLTVYTNYRYKATPNLLYFK